MKLPAMNKILLMLGGRLLIGYLMYRLATNKVEALQITTSKQASSSSSSSLSSFMHSPQEEFVCTIENINQKIDESLDENNVEQVAGELFSKCRKQFVDKNHVSPIVKETVDKWLNIDLSTASSEQRWEAYQVALMSSETQRIDNRLFIDDCINMEKSYELYQTDISQLADYINIQDDWWLPGKQDDDINSINDSETKDLMNYAQYTLFCSAMIANEEQ